MNIIEKLKFSTEILSKTKLPEKDLQAMTESMYHHHLLQYFIINLNLHISQQGYAHSHPTMTVYTIYQHLITTNTPVNFQLKSFKKFKSNMSQFTLDQMTPEKSTLLNNAQPEMG